MSQPEQTESRADPITLNEFIGSLQRLFKIGVYYPSGHVILDKATDRFMAQLKSLAGDQRAVTIEDYKDSLKLEDIEISSDVPFVQEFKELLATLGIIAVSFDREISGPELHTFVRKMLAYRARILGAKQFTQVEVSELPSSISLQLKEFLARKDASISDELSGESSENLDTFIESLTNYGLSREEVGKCKDLLDSLPEQFSQQNVDESNLPYASWDDVARLLARAVRKGTGDDSELRDRVSTHSNINALASILEKLEGETADKKSRETINLIVSIIRKPIDAQAEEIETLPESVSRVFPDKPYFSTRQIQEFTAKNRLHIGVLEKIPQNPTTNETLSIVIQLAQYDQSMQTQIRIQHAIRDVLSGPIQDKTWEILSGGMQMVVAGGNANRISSLIRLITEPMRRSKHANTLYFFLLTLRRCKPEDIKLLWPYVVNEILVNGCGTDQASYQNLCQFAANFPPQEMIAALPTLRNLDAFQDHTIAPDIFHGLPPRCFSLFAFLLKTEIEQFVGERVIGGLRRNPVDWLIKAVAPVLDLSVQEHKLFLYSYLRQAGQKVLPESLKKVAAQILATQFPQMPEDKRTEAWVCPTINTLSQLPYPESTALLKEISGSKKLLFIPQWPAECRRAAEQTLAKTKRR